MDKEKMIDDIVAMLDGSMAEGTGHINVKVSEDGKIEKDVKTMGCPDCLTDPMACQVPTVFFDDEEK